MAKRRKNVYKPLILLAYIAVLDFFFHQNIFIYALIGMAIGIGVGIPLQLFVERYRK